MIFALTLIVLPAAMTTVVWALLAPGVSLHINSSRQAMSVVYMHIVRCIPKSRLRMLARHNMLRSARFDHKYNVVLYPS